VERYVVPKENKLVKPIRLMVDMEVPRADGFDKCHRNIAKRKLLIGNARCCVLTNSEVAKLMMDKQVR